jgi:hypothetical protein
MVGPAQRERDRREPGSLDLDAWTAIGPSEGGHPSEAVPQFETAIGPGHRSSPAAGHASHGALDRLVPRTNASLDVDDVRPVVDTASEAQREARDDPRVQRGHAASFQADSMPLGRTRECHRQAPTCSKDRSTPWRDGRSRGEDVPHQRRSHPFASTTRGPTTRSWLQSCGPLLRVAVQRRWLRHPLARGPRRWPRRTGGPGRAGARAAPRRPPRS